MFAFDKPLMWIIILIIVMLLFGANKLPEIGKGLGRSITEFKSEMNSSDVKKYTKKEEELVEVVTPKPATPSSLAMAALAESSFGKQESQEVYAKQ